MKPLLYVGLMLCFLVPGACNPSTTTFSIKPSQEGADPGKVEEVTVSGSAGSFTFSVTLSSPDTGCDQYADWWEVVSDSGALLYRRILAHSHVDEQPFTRSGSPVPITSDQKVWVRMHMNTTGYSQAGMTGSAAGGFTATEIPEDFAPSLETEAPLPNGCAF